MKKATTAQLQKLHILLKQAGLLDEKANFVYSITKGRTASSKELTINEATALISSLVKNGPCEKMKNKVFALAYDAGIIWGNSEDDKKINAVKLNQFLLKKGTVKKELNKMHHDELVKVVSQFCQMVKHMHESSAKKATTALLTELNILTETTIHQNG